MSIEREAADDVIHIGLQTISMTAALTFGGGMYLAKLIEKAALNGKNDKSGKNLRSVLESPMGVEVFPLYKEFEGVFAQEARRHDLKFSIIKDENEKCDVYPLLVSRGDKNVVDRIYEKLKLYDHESLPQQCAGEKREGASEEFLKEINSMMKEIKNEIEKRDVMRPSPNNKDILNDTDTYLSGAKNSEYMNPDDMDRESVRRKMAELRSRREKLFENIPERHAALEK